MAKSVGQELAKGLWETIPPFRLVLGLCPTLAVTTSLENGLGMGLATTFVLLCSNIVVSLLKALIPAKVRIPAYIVIIATFVTVVDLLMKHGVEVARADRVARDAGLRPGPADTPRNTCVALRTYIPWRDDDSEVTLVTDRDYVLTMYGKLAARYPMLGGQPVELDAESLENAFGRFAEKNTAVVVEPVKIISWDHRKLGGGY